MHLTVTPTPEPNPASALDVAESRTLAPELAGLAGTHALWVGATATVLPATPLLSCWTRLHLYDGLYHGDLQARADEPLPFHDDAFRAVVLSHALEWAPNAPALLDEAVRVLVPEGLLVVTGFHALSTWSPWLLCRRGPRPVLSLPARWTRLLATHGVQVYAVHRYGAVLPMLHDNRGADLLGGGFKLLARKRRLQITPLRSPARKQAAPVPRLAPGAHRECA